MTAWAMLVQVRLGKTRKELGQRIGTLAARKWAGGHDEGTVWDLLRHPLTHMRTRRRCRLMAPAATLLDGSLANDATPKCQMLGSLGKKRSRNSKLLGASQPARELQVPRLR